MMLFALLATTLLAACTQDELAERGHTLPEGQYPLELTTASLGAMAIPTTRGTVDGTWNGGEIICVQVASSLDYADTDNIPWEQVPVINYTVSQDGTMKLVDASSIVYWQSTNETKYIRAWRAGTSGYNGVPVSSAETVKISNWATNTVQSTTTMAADDFLYAYKELTFAGKAESGIQLRHLLSKFTINLVGTPYLEAHAQNEVSVSLSCSETSSWNVEGKFKGYGADFELYEGFNLWSADITPYKLSTPASSTYYATYEALVIPQTTNIGNKVIKVKVGEATYTWAVQLPDALVSLKGGQAYTFNITVKEHGLEVTVDNSIPWGVGGSGSGSVMIAESIDLSDGNAVNITDNGTYKISGSGTKPITINGSPLIYLENANVAVTDAYTPAVNITGGSPTIYVKGQDNSLSSSKYGGILMSNNANLRITASSKEAGTLTVKAGTQASRDEFKALNNPVLMSFVGIGAATNCTCGNITIDNVRLNVSGGHFSDNRGGAAAIGTSAPASNGTTQCGEINIKSSEVYATSGAAAAAIGTGYTGGSFVAEMSNAHLVCSKIVIDNSTLDITVIPVSEYNYYGAGIGTGFCDKVSAGYADTRIGRILIDCVSMDEAPLKDFTKNFRLGGGIGNPGYKIGWGYHNCDNGVGCTDHTIDGLYNLEQTIVATSMYFGKW